MLTALAGASTIVLGSMLLFGVIDLDDFDSAVTTEALAPFVDFYLTDENRELLAYDGWTRYVDEPPDFFSPGAKGPEPV